MSSDNSEIPIDLIVINERIAELETKIEDRIDDRMVIVENRLDKKLDSMLEQLLAVVSVNHGQTTRLREDMQTGILSLNDKIIAVKESVQESVQETKSELWRNITE